MTTSATLGLFPLILALSNTLAMDLSLPSSGVLTVAGIVAGSSSTLFFTTTLAVASADSVVCPFSLTLYFTSYTPAGVLAATFI